MNNFLLDTNRYVNKALKYSELSDDLAKKIITCNSTYTVRFGVRPYTKSHSISRITSNNFLS